MTRTKVQNRHNINLAVNIEGENNTKGLVFVVHGLGGYKEQVHIRAMTETFLEAGYTVVAYDAANAIGESGGKIEDATLTNYFEDLEDVIGWAGSREWYTEPFIIAGHSLGGASALMYAAEYPERVKAVVPVSSFIAGGLRLETLDKDELHEWRKKGFVEEVSQSKPGVVKKISWNFMEDAMQHDMRTLADKIQCPTLFVVGSEDDMTPTKHQKLMLDLLNTPAEIHVINGMEHNPRSVEHNAELKEVVSAWSRALGE